MNIYAQVELLLIWTWWKRSRRAGSRIPHGWISLNSATFINSPAFLTRWVV